MGICSLNKNLRQQDSKRTMPNCFFPVITLLLALSLQQPASTQPVPKPEANPLLSPDQLQQDFEVFKASLTEVHPGLNWYATEAELAELFSRVEATTQQPMRELDLYTQLADIVSAIRCGHTSIWPSQRTNNATWSSGRFLPLQLKLMNGRAYCLRNLSDANSAPQPGNEIVAINGWSIDSLLCLANCKLSGDGYNTTRKVDLLERYLHDFLAFHVGLPDNYRIDYIAASGERTSTNVGAVPWSSIAAQTPASPEREAANLDLQFVDDGTAMLTIREFGNWQHGKRKIKFSKVLASLFQQLDSAATEHLIVDVRNNGGGHDALGLELLSYFASAPVVEFKSMNHRLNRSEYAQYSDLSNFQRALIRLLFRSRKTNDATHELRAFKTLKPYAPSTPGYRGKVYILINGRSYSTTADFCALMKSQQHATFIGQETGGCYYGNSSWLPVRVTLPNSNIRLKLPTVRYTTNVAPLQPTGRGILPDYPIHPTIQDVLSGTDCELNFTLELINNHD